MRAVLQWLCLVGMAAPVIAQTPNDAAIRFGARDNVLGVTIAPDGKSLAILQPNGPRGTIVTVASVDGSREPKAILSADGNPNRLTGCRWSTASRLICTTAMIETIYGKRRAMTRLVAIDSDGGNMKALSARANDRSLGFALGGGDVIDWLADRDGDVLMQRWFVPETSTGTMFGSSQQGLGVERVDVHSLARTLVEPANGAAVEYITDGHGNVRIMTLSRSNALGQDRDVYDYRYRKKGSKEWLPLTTVKILNYHADGFQPLAVDSDLDVVYGLDRSEGRDALYKIALDGSMKKEHVFARPDASIDGLIEIGRQDRVVGASWITDKRQTAMFDPVMARFTASLSKALPNLPNVSVIDASADEQKLVIFAGSDVDPGKFYLYDKPTRKLAEILPTRPLLANTKLAAMQAIHYPAADGTMVPAYLTLPADGQAKNLPAIVLPHGGPTYRDEWNFDWLPQYFASRGYAVIQPEYRGSSGYGTEWFQQNAIRSWRTAIGDVDDAGRWLVQQGIANPTQLGIVGWSYGGYAALQSQVIDPALFKAVVAIAPVTDFGLIRQGDDDRSTKEALDAVFGNATTAEEGSPARHADRFSAPVLLFQGDNDLTVPVAQARLMRSRLKSAGKSVELVEFNGLDHQLDDTAARAAMLDKADSFLRTTMKIATP